MSALTDRITEVLDAHFEDLPPSIRDWINTPEVAERVAAALQLTEETFYSRSPDVPPRRRWVSGWTPYPEECGEDAAGC